MTHIARELGPTSSTFNALKIHASHSICPRGLLAGGRMDSPRAVE